MLVHCVRVLLHTLPIKVQIQHFTLSKLLVRGVYQRITFESKNLILNSQAVILSRGSRNWALRQRHYADPRVSQPLQKRPLYSLHVSDTLIQHPCVSHPYLVATRGQTRTRGQTQRHLQISQIRTSIFGEQKDFQRSRGHRETLYHITSVLTRFDSFPEKLTFIQNSLLLLYICEKNKK